MDADAAGGAVTGGLIAGVLEKRTGHAGERRAVCSDCGAAVTANFCAECGQPTHVHRKLTHLGEELLHGVMHFDGRIWRTLPLLVLNPGRLTREWIAGRRTSYVSPLAAFLFTVFLMFFAFSFLGVGALEPRVVEERIAAQAEELADQTAKLRKLESDAAGQDVAARNVATAELQAQREQVAREQATLDRLKAEKASGGSAKRDDGLTHGTWQAELADAVKYGDLKVNTGNKVFDERIKKKLANPDLTAYKIQQTFYKFAFLLVPLSIPAVALLFLWKRGHTWYDHGVFVLYSLTFMALLFMILALTERLPDAITSVIGLAAMVAVPAHMFAQLKGTYGLSWLSAVWRTVALLWLSFFVLIAFVLCMIFLGLTG